MWNFANVENIFIIILEEEFLNFEIWNLLISLLRFLSYRGFFKRKFLYLYYSIHLTPTNQKTKNQGLHVIDRKPPVSLSKKLIWLTLYFSSCFEKQKSCTECRNWASFMPGYYYSWNGPNHKDNPNRCHLHKKSILISGSFYKAAIFYI